MTDAENVEAPPASQNAPSQTKLRWPLWIAALLLGLIIWNGVVTVPVARALSDEEGSTTVAYRRWLISPNEIVFDLWSIDGSQSMAAMDRRLFKAAEALQDRSYDRVVLAYHGRAKFLMDGTYFQEVGATRQTQNPVYTMRTMQERLYNPDGSPAFETWTGGWLGVLGQQLEDHNRFHKRWWVGEELGLPDTAADVQAKP